MTTLEVQYNCGEEVFYTDKNQDIKTGIVKLIEISALGTSYIINDDRIPESLVKDDVESLKIEIESSITSEYTEKLSKVRQVTMESLRPVEVIEEENKIISNE